MADESSDGTGRKKIREVLKKNDAMIAEHSFMYQMVFGDPEEPGFIYTIGMSRQDLPEFIFVGSCSNDAVNYLRGAVAVALSGDEVPLGLIEPETEINPFLVPMFILQADEKLNTHAFGIRSDLMRQKITNIPKVLQVVMPDMQGRFPWEPGYDWLNQQVSNPPIAGIA